jgi:hypothetical protein
MGHNPDTFSGGLQLALYLVIRIYYKSMIRRLDTSSHLHGSPVTIYKVKQHPKFAKARPRPWYYIVLCYADAYKSVARCSSTIDHTVRSVVGGGGGYIVVDPRSGCSLLFFFFLLAVAKYYVLVVFAAIIIKFHLQRLLPRSFL